ncbi:hypothetical protein HDU97_010115 [Phlyctochytrium planicorne]|nr:hypothetical protein HDU97_010115 [Phlyctochytrium planicorne]
MEIKGSITSQGVTASVVSTGSTLSETIRNLRQDINTLLTDQLAKSGIAVEEDKANEEEGDDDESME